MTRNEGRRRLASVIAAWLISVKGMASLRAPTFEVPLPWALAPRAPARGAPTLLLTGSCCVVSGPLSSPPVATLAGSCAGGIGFSSLCTWLCHSLDNRGGFVPVSSSVTVIQVLPLGQ